MLKENVQQLLSCNYVLMLFIVVNIRAWTQSSHTVIVLRRHCACVQGPSALQAALPSTAFLFGGICFREVLMDINDRRGDAAAGVRTLPVALSPRAALALATGVALAGGSAAAAALAGCHVPAAAAAAAAAAASSCGAAADAMVGAAAVRAAVVAAFLWSTAAVTLRDAVRVARSGFDHRVVEAAIGGSFTPIGIGLVILAVCL